MMTKRLMPLVALLLTLVVPARGAEPFKILATVPTYGALARTIGGDLVEVVVFTRPTQDAHGVTALPSLIGRALGADMLLHTGLDAELWLEGMLRGSGNVRLLPGGPNKAAVNLSDGVALKQVPALVSRAQGDFHAYGNTHIWTDPMIVRGMAEKVRDALIDALPEHEEVLRERHATFHRELTQALVRWLTEYADLKGEKVVVFHQSWVYLFERFGIEQVATLEPQPRVVPSVRHLNEVVEAMRTRDVGVVVREPFQPPKATDFVHRETDAEVLVLSTHPGFPDSAETIIEHFDHNLAELARALRDARREP